MYVISYCLDRHFSDLISRGLQPNAAAAIAAKMVYGKGDDHAAGSTFVSHFGTACLDTSLYCSQSRNRCATTAEACYKRSAISGMAVGSQSGPPHVWFTRDIGSLVHATVLCNSEHIHNAVLVCRMQLRGH